MTSQSTVGNRESPRGQRGLFWVVGSLFVVSGATALLYQVVWVRMLTHVLGATVLAISTVLSAFMGGLALGSFFGGRLATRTSSPLKAYAALEFGIALYAALTPLLLQLANGLYAGAYASLSGEFWALSMLRFVVSLLVLLPPTFLMGATLPLLATLAPQFGGHTARVVAWLYASNTLGAVVGTLAASFVFLGTLGVRGTLYAGVVANLVVGVVALVAARHSRGSAEDSFERVAHPTTIPRGIRLIAVATLGFSGLALEVLWTRSLTLSLGTTTYAFAIVLAMFLMGIATGSAAADRLLRHPRFAERMFVFAPAAIGLLTLAVLPFFDRFPELFASLVANSQGGFRGALLAQFTIAGVALLPITFLYGVSFPLAVALDETKRPPGRSVAELYAWNTVGAILGSWAAGFLMLRFLGLQVGIQTLAIGLVVITVLMTVSTRRTRRVAIASGALLLAGVVALTSSSWNTDRLTRGEYVRLDERPDESESAGHRILFHEEGLNTTVTVRQYGSSRSMQMNGVTEASEADDMATLLLLGHWPALLHGAPQDALVIGLGGGASLAAVARHPVKSLACVELSEAVVRGAEYFAASTDSVLSDSRLQLILGDGRNHLLLSERQYDLIVSEPSNVWIAGMGSLFTAEHFELCRERLRPGGVLCQWIHGYSIPPEALRRVLAAVRLSFDHVLVSWGLWGDFLILAKNEPFNVSPSELSERMLQPGVREHLEEAGTPDASSLLSLVLLAGVSVDEFVGSSPPHTDDDLYLELNIPKALGKNQLRDVVEELERFPPELAPILRTNETLSGIETAFEARSLESKAQLSFREGRGVEGIADLRQANALLPSAGSIKRLLARALTSQAQFSASQGDLSSALSGFAEAFRLDSANYAPVLGAAQIHLRAGNATAALQAAELTVALEPELLDHRLVLASALASSGRYADAALQAQRGLAIEPDNARAHLILGRCFEELGETSRALSTYQAGLEFHPEDVDLNSRQTALETRSKP